jgi:DivIVA domain-containing protein
MPLTPEDVHNKQFTTVRLREGYDEEEVDAFLDEVEAELTRLIRENEELRAKLAAATRAAQANQMAPVPQRREPTPIPPPPPAPMPVPVPVAPPPQLTSGGDSAARVLALAQQTADQAIAEARNEANKIFSEARTRAEGLEREARSKADALERDAQEKHRVAMGALEQSRASLERKVEDLRAFEREYRQRLKSYLESQMRQLESQGADDPAPASRPQMGGGPVASLPPGIAASPSPGMSNGGMPSPAMAGAMTQTMAPVRPPMQQMPQPMQPPMPQPPSPMRGFLIDEDPDS